MTDVNRILTVSSQKPNEHLVAALSIKGQALLQVIDDILDEKLRIQKPIEALDILLGIARELGGTQFYLPQERFLLSVVRAQEIIEKSDQGQNVTEIAKEYGLSVQTIYRIIKSKGDKPCH